jgi:hypothetical protein
VNVYKLDQKKYLSGILDLFEFGIVATQTQAFTSLSRINFNDVFRCRKSLENQFRKLPIVNQEKNLAAMIRSLSGGTSIVDFYESHTAPDPETSEEQQDLCSATCFLLFSAVGIGRFSQVCNATCFLLFLAVKIG